LHLRWQPLSSISTRLAPSHPAYTPLYTYVPSKTKRKKKTTSVGALYEDRLALLHRLRHVVNRVHDEWLQLLRVLLVPALLALLLALLAALRVH
jgi:hypothetical protein